MIDIPRGKLRGTTQNQTIVIIQDSFRDMSSCSSKYLLYRSHVWGVIKKDAIERTCVPIETGFSDEVKRYTESVGAQNLDELVARYPLRETGVFDEIGKALKCRDRWDYERMVVARIQDDKLFRDSIKDRLRPLVDELGTKENTD